MLQSWPAIITIMEIFTMAQSKTARDEDLGGFPKDFTWNLDGTINTIICNGYQKDGVTPAQWIKTFTWTSGKVTNVTGWILQ